MGEINLTVWAGETMASMGWDALGQLWDWCWTGKSFDWVELGIAGAIGGGSAGLGAAARYQFYQRNTLKALTWAKESVSFSTYFTKMIGIGTATSGAEGGKLFPLWRSLCSGAGTRAFAAAYNFFVEGQMMD
jgi:hypothetical protein